MREISKSNQNSIEKDAICYKKIMDVRSKINNEEAYIYVSPIGKVQYKVLKTISNMFETSTYETVFKMLYSLENKLSDKLPFTIELDFITLEAFRKAIKENREHLIETSGIEKALDEKAINRIVYTPKEELYKIVEEMGLPSDSKTLTALEDIQLNSFEHTVETSIGENLFYLLNDITIQNTAIRSEEISAKYLYNTALVKLNDFYNLNRDLVLACFDKGYSSLYLYGTVYNGERFRENTLGKVYDILEDETETKLRIELAQDLLLEFHNELRNARSEESSTDICNAMYRINQKMDSFDDNRIRKLKNHTIDAVYDSL